MSGSIGSEMNSRQLEKKIDGYGINFGKHVAD